VHAGLLRAYAEVMAGHNDRGCDALQKIQPLSGQTPYALKVSQLLALASCK
jgi:hypothetical protein